MDPGNKARIMDPGDEAWIRDPGNESWLMGWGLNSEAWGWGLNIGSWKWGLNNGSWQWGNDDVVCYSSSIFIPTGVRQLFSSMYTIGQQKLREVFTCYKILCVCVAFLVCKIVMQQFNSVVVNCNCVSWPFHLCIVNVLSCSSADWTGHCECTTILWMHNYTVNFTNAGSNYQGLPLKAVW